MEFKIQRYQGKEDEETICAEKQSDLFQARIEERRHKREEHVLKRDSTSNEKENVKRKKKKLNNDDFDHIHVKKKKKKNLSGPDADSSEVPDYKEDDSSADIINEVVSPTEGSIKKAARKKAKQKLNSEQNANLDKIDIESESNEHMDTPNCDNKDGKTDGGTFIEGTAQQRKTKRKKKKHISQDLDDTPNVEITDSDVGKGASDQIADCELGTDTSKCNKEILDADNITSKEGTIAALCENEVENIVEKSTENYFPILGKHSKPKTTSVKRTLPRWLNEPIFMPVDIDLSKVCIKSVDYLSETVLKNLTVNGIDYLFPVQSSVISKIISQNKNVISKFPPRDVCVQAPTGSGKTLAYVLPIIDILSKYIVRQLYCLVVVPSKDLAVQVCKVFETYTVGTNLKVAIACGSKTFSKEQEKLVAKGGKGKVDIIVCTPGRLVDHLKQTPDFSLNNLRFLVVDEADRLLGQDYNSWLEEVKASVHSANGYSNKRLKLSPINASTFMVCQMPFQKLLFSATLTQNPEKIAPLELFHPVLFTSKVDHSKLDNNDDDGDTGKLESEDTDADRYIIPEKLEEKIIVVNIDQKPLVVVYLMLVMKWKGVLCFTKSIEATHRLHLLMQSFSGFTVAEFSSTLSETQRKGIIRDFNSGKVDLLISSDAMARGMDIDTVKLVVNYDTAANAKTYVHRVGRTARAGKEGCAMTILCSKEVYHFKLMMKKLTDKRIPKMSIPKEILDSYQDDYGVALSTLQEKISQENKIINSGNFVKRT